MTALTDPADAVVYVTSTVVAGGMVTTEQGSGVLIAPDEVLTAAHVVYDGSGHTYADTVVTAGGGSATAGAASVHAMPDADWTQLSNAGGDFALIHLAAPLAGVPTMSLGSVFAGGAATVTGYPEATAGARDSLAEALSAVPGYAGVLQGAALGAPGDPHGSSGGPVWTDAGGAPTVVGLVQSVSGTAGYFLQLTAADVAQIQAWEAADAAGAAPAALSAPAPPQTPALAAVADLSGEVGGFPALGSGPLAGAAARMVAVLQRDAAALGAGAEFEDAAASALADLGDGRHPLAAALLEGLAWGHGGGDPAGAVSAVAAADPGVLSAGVRQRAVHAGAVLGGALLSDGR